MARSAFPSATGRHRDARRSLPRPGDLCPSEPAPQRSAPRWPRPRRAALPAGGAPAGHAPVLASAPLPFMIRRRGTSAELLPRQRSPSPPPAIVVKPSSVAAADVPRRSPPCDLGCGGGVSHLAGAHNCTTAMLGLGGCSPCRPMDKLGRWTVKDSVMEADCNVFAYCSSVL